MPSSGLMSCPPAQFLHRDGSPFAATSASCVAVLAGLSADVTWMSKAVGGNWWPVRKRQSRRISHHAGMTCLSPISSQETTNAELGGATWQVKSFEKESFQGDTRPGSSAIKPGEGEGDREGEREREGDREREREGDRQGEGEGEGDRERGGEGEGDRERGGEGDREEEREVPCSEGEAVPLGRTGDLSNASCQTEGGTGGTIGLAEGQRENKTGKKEWEGRGESVAKRRWVRLPDGQALAKEGHQEALRLSRRRDVTGARTAFHLLLSSYPSNVHIRTSAAIFEWRNGRRELAREIFKQGALLDPTNAPIRQAWGLMEAARGEKGTKKARQLLKAATEADQFHGASWQAWGVFEQRRGNARMARQLFQKGTERVPNHVPTWQAWGLLEASEGQLSTARTLLQTATSLDPSHGPAWLAWARLEWKEGNFEEARVLFEKGTEIPGKDAASVLQAWASVEAEAKNETKARKLFQRAARRDPSLPFTWLQWGRLERSQGNLEDAAEIFRSGLRVDPTNVHLQHALGMLEKDRGNFQEARRVLTAAMEGAPENSHILGTLAEVEGATGAITKARTLAQEALKSSHSTKGTAILYEKLANIEANSDRPEVASYIFAEASAAAPNDARILRSWALFEKAMGKAKETSELFRRSAKADPNLSRTWLQWGLWEMELGNLLKARAVFDRGLEFNPESPHLFLAWAKMEQRERDFSMARELYEAGCNACPKYGPLWAAWGTMEWDVWKEIEGERMQKEGEKETLMQGERNWREGGRVEESRGGGGWVETESRGSETGNRSTAVSEESNVQGGKQEDNERENGANIEERHKSEDVQRPLIASDSMGVCTEMTSKVVKERDLGVSVTEQIDGPDLVSISGQGECLLESQVGREAVKEESNEAFIEKRAWEQSEERERERESEVKIRDSLKFQGNQEDRSSSILHGYSRVSLSEVGEMQEDEKFWDKKKRFRANQERHLAVKNGIQRANEIFSEGAEKAAHYPPLFQRWKKMLYSIGNRRRAMKICQLARRQEADPCNKVPNIIQSAFQKSPRRRNWSGWENGNRSDVESVERVVQSVLLESDDERRVENLGQAVVKGSKAIRESTREGNNQSKWRREYMGERWKRSEGGSWKGSRMVRQIKECGEEKKPREVDGLYLKHDSEVTNP